MIILETEHTLLVNGMYRTIKTYCYFFNSVAVIPESDYAEDFLREYAPKFAIVVFFK